MLSDGFNLSDIGNIFDLIVVCYGFIWFCIIAIEVLYVYYKEKYHEKNRIKHF